MTIRRDRRQAQAEQAYFACVEDGIERLLSAQKVMWETIGVFDGTCPRDCEGPAMMTPESMVGIKKAQADMTMALMRAKWEPLV